MTANAATTQSNVGTAGSEVFVSIILVGGGVIRGVTTGATVGVAAGVGLATGVGEGDGLGLGGVVGGAVGWNVGLGDGEGNGVHRPTSLIPSVLELVSLDHLTQRVSVLVVTGLFPCTPTTVSDQVTPSGLVW
jgi:hypothetical protein